MEFTTRKSEWSRPSFTSIPKLEKDLEETLTKGKKKLNSISSLVEEQVNNNQARLKSQNNNISNSNGTTTRVIKPRFKKNNSISSLVETIDKPSLYSKSNVISSLVEEMSASPKPEETYKPRFSMFGKKANITEINNRSLEQDQKAIEANTIATAKKKRYSGKFEYHPSQKKRKVVKFNPIFLERVCLFLQEQSPHELKEAHDKHLLNPPFRIICSHWPSSQDSTTILLNKKSFSIAPDNTCIRGKLMIRNLALDKSVLIRYTFDAWDSVRDVDATFFGPNPKNTAYDIYEFVMDLDHRQLADRGEMRGKLEFSVRCTIGDEDYWDNNNGKNYQIKIYSDPLNDPWKLRNDKLQKESISKESSSSEEEEEYLSEEENETKEKHSQFANALKGYKHAKPYHLNRRQPWLGTRYDFSQSLYLAKVAPYDTWTPALHPDSSLIADCMSESETKTKDNNKSLLYTSVSAPPSPNASPLLSPSNTLEFNSEFYLNLLNKYCFYTPKDET